MDYTTTFEGMAMALISEPAAPAVSDYDAYILAASATYDAQLVRDYRHVTDNP